MTTDRRLWLLGATPPVAWFTAQQIAFLLAPRLCQSASRWPLTPLFAATLLAAAGAGLVGFHEWRKSAEGSRRRFMAAAGALLGLLCSLGIAALALAALVHQPCD